ncbi:hypothetical protein DY000_02010095 [Brassica cretica]|uniref:MATH domain-containing protein n=1 Tax=Brassica cretica TaxID=69181 RepID=A0ABQ7CAI0_BRACR|nr:hypothetical protein DY000_02010095 [Brassica cretica]
MSSSSEIVSTIVKKWREHPPSSYSLKVDNFKQLEKSTTSSDDKYQSRLFSSGGYNWKLIVYPQGNKKDNGEGFISMYVEIDSESLTSTPQCDSVPKKKGRLFGLGRRTRSVPPSSAPPPFVDPEVLTAQLKDKDDRISLLETQMAAQQAGYEAHKRLNQQMMEMMQRMYPNEVFPNVDDLNFRRTFPRNIPRDTFLGIYRRTHSSEFSEGSVPRKFPMKVPRNISSEFPRIGPSENPSKYPEEVRPRYIPRIFPTNWWSSEFPRKFISSEFRRKFPRGFRGKMNFRGVISEDLFPRTCFVGMSSE